ncbi:carboxyl-terminal protease-like protein [Marinobacter sp. F3R11]|uniref:carboxyl-terminal protease-like protein n=1 Tax=Marinobacter sp. F3R11 TaxID=2267231 RepID=UPI000DEA0444|nr:carboxyl-terminal protease-like protein [Marinobacter sp. F3R11]RBW49224.1 carboxyl-terminal protease-like protein [Marinobacter sp. F3R11]
MKFRRSQNSAGEIHASAFQPGKALLSLVMVALLTGCQVYQFDRNSVSAPDPSPYGTGTVPFTVVGDERPDWLVPESAGAPEVVVTRTTEKTETSDFEFLSFLGYMVSLTLIPYHEEIPFSDVYALTWQGETLLESRINYSIDNYFSVYFPTPLLFLGSQGDQDAEKAVARAYITDYHKANVLTAIDQQRIEFERFNPQTAEEIAAYLSGPGANSVYRPSAVLRLIDQAPETSALAYHAANSHIAGYLDLLPVRYQAWLIGPDGLRGIDLENQLTEGVEADQLLVQMLNAYPDQTQGIQSGYYTGMTQDHREVLKEAGLPEGLVDRMTNEAPSAQLLAAARTGKLRDENGNIRIPSKAELLEQLVRNDNQGQYLSPYTSDDVLAEWVNSAINANIGATVGTGVGAAAGAYMGEKALEQVPFVGSFLGGAVGAEVGKSVGRETAINASGGWEAIRASSDRSFDNIHSMARYLREKYEHTGNFSDAINATQQIYPELAEALAQVR